MPTYYLDGTTGSDVTGNGTEGAPYRTPLPIAASGVLPADTVLYATGIIEANSGGAPFRVTAGTLTLRAWRDSRPRYRVPRGFKAAGAANLDAEDIVVEQTGTTNNTGLHSREGGSLRAVRCDTYGFQNGMQGGSGPDGGNYIDGCNVYYPRNNGIYIDPVDTVTATSFGVIRNCYAIGNIPSDNDLFVLHDGGIGWAQGWLIEGCTGDLLGAGENAFDVQQQFPNAVLRNNTARNCGQFAVTEGAGYRGNFANIGEVTDGRFQFQGALQTGKIRAHNGNWVTLTSDPGATYTFLGTDTTNAANWVRNHPITAGGLRIEGMRIENARAGIQLNNANAVVTGWEMTGITRADYTTAGGITGGGGLFRISSRATGFLIEGGYGEDVGDTAATRGLIRLDSGTTGTFVNNTIRRRSGSSATATPPIFSLGDSTPAAYTIDRNAYVHERDGANAHATLGVTTLTYAAWRSTYATKDPNSLSGATQAALGIDPSTRMLQAGSSLIGAGAAQVGAASVDVAGRARATPPDIGAYAYISNVDASAITPTLRTLWRLAPQLAAGGTPPPPPPPAPTMPPAAQVLYSGPARSIDARFFGSHFNAFPDSRVDFPSDQALTVSSVNTSADTITGNTNQFRHYDKVRFTSGTPPTGLSLNTDYWIRNLQTNETTFQLSATQGGAAINITGTQTGAKMRGIVVEPDNIPFIGWARVGVDTGCEWAALHTAAATYDWTQLDLSVLAHWAAGRQVVYCLRFTPQWLSRHGGATTPYPNTDWQGGGYAPRSADLGRVREFAAAMITRYCKVSAVNPLGAQMLLAIETMNEPRFNGGILFSGTGTYNAAAHGLLMNDLAEMGRQIELAVADAAVPTVQVWGPGFMNPIIDGSISGAYTDEGSWTRRFLQATCADGTRPGPHLDAFGFHAYRWHIGWEGTNTGPDQVYAAYRRIRDRVDGEGWGPLPIVMTEAGFENEEQMDPTKVIRTLLCAIAAGVKHWCMYGHNYSDAATIGGTQGFYATRNNATLCEALTDFGEQLLGARYTQIQIDQAGTMSIRLEGGAVYTY